MAARMLSPKTTEVRLLTVLSLELYPSPYTLDGKQMADMQERLQEVREAVEQSLKKPRRIFEEAGHAVETRHRFGNPPEEILGEIKDWSPDLVVMGRWWARAPERWVHGSVFDRVMRHADVPVLVVSYHPEHEARAGQERRLQSG